MEKTVYRIHFEDRSGTEFERFSFAYLTRIKQWDTLDWYGQSGTDGGRDIWGVCAAETFCYQCANYSNLTVNKGKEDIDKLKDNKTLPDNFILICGGKVSANTKQLIIDYAKKTGIKKVAVWSGVEFEEKLRNDSPDLIQRFVEGIVFPDSPIDLINFAKSSNDLTDKEIIGLLSECLDRPAFTTRFWSESNIPDFEKAIKDTIEVLNTGVHRLRDGTEIRRIPSRHRISNNDIKLKLAEITKLVVKLRDSFIELKRKKEIRPCECGEVDCSVYMLSDNACEIMDNSRNEILDKIRLLKPDFDLRID